MQRTDANLDRVQNLVHSDQRLGVRLIAEKLNMNRETVQEIITDDLGMRRISAKS
jgi:predicted transcriptional regulator